MRGAAIWFWGICFGPSLSERPGASHLATAALGAALDRLAVPARAEGRCKRKAPSGVLRALARVAALNCELVCVYGTQRRSICSQTAQAGRLAPRRHAGGAQTPSLRRFIRLQLYRQLQSAPTGQGLLHPSPPTLLLPPPGRRDVKDLVARSTRRPGPQPAAAGQPLNQLSHYRAHMAMLDGIWGRALGGSGSGSGWRSGAAALQVAGGLLEEMHPRTCLLGCSWMCTAPAVPVVHGR